MAKPKKKLSTAQKKAKAERKKKYKTVFINGKQVRVKRPSLIDGIPEHEWIAQNADPIWLHQNGLWDVLESRTQNEEDSEEVADEIPF